jgi:capsid assembly protease
MLNHLAGRIFNAPLLIAPAKLEAILAVLGPRLGIDAPPPSSGTKRTTAAPSAGQRKPYRVTGDGIAIIPIEGTLVHKSYGLDALSGLRSYMAIRQEFEDAVNDPAIRGILLDVDSPGGEVAGVFDLADLIYQARDKKPIYSVANNDSYSASYVLASAAGRLHVSRTSGVGSIGVVVTHLDVSAADQEAGYKYTVIHAGARKADFHPHAVLSDPARGVLEKEVQRVYDLLVGTVARNRSMLESAIRQTEAGLYFGGHAIHAGLADREGTLQDALRDMRDYFAGRKVMGAMGAAGKVALAPVAVKPAPAADVMLRAVGKLGMR